MERSLTPTLSQNSLLQLLRVSTWMEELQDRPIFEVASNLLVGGITTPLKNMKVSWDDENSQYMENHKIPCSLWDDYIVTWDDYSQYMEK